MLDNSADGKRRGQTGESILARWLFFFSILLLLTGVLAWAFDFPVWFVTTAIPSALRALLCIPRSLFLSFSLSPCLGDTQLVFPEGAA